MDYNLWKQAADEKDIEDQGRRQQDKIPSKDQVYAKCGSHVCFTYASWISKYQKAGIVWILQQRNGKCILQGKSPIEVVDTSMEAEAIALQLAV